MRLIDEYDHAALGRHEKEVTTEAMSAEIAYSRSAVHAGKEDQEERR